MDGRVWTEIANDIWRKLVLYHQAGYGPSQFSALPQMGARSDRIQAALAFAKENLKDALPVAVLAEVAQLSPRHKSPQLIFAVDVNNDRNDYGKVGNECGGWC